MAALGLAKVQEAISLLADGLLVWQVADRTGFDRRTVANIKKGYYGLILGIQRERAGQDVDGSPRHMRHKREEETRMEKGKEIKERKKRQAPAVRTRPQPALRPTAFVSRTGNRAYQIEADPDGKTVLIEGFDGRYDLGTVEVIARELQELVDYARKLEAAV